MIDVHQDEKVVTAGTQVSLCHCIISQKETHGC